MPELPEVETVVRDLRTRILNKKTTKVEILLPRIIKSRNFNKKIIGNRFVDIERIGKLIIIILEKGGFLLVHLKMTGQLIYQKGRKIIAGGHDDGQDMTSLPNKYSRVIFSFQDNSRLYFNDLRTFGYLKLVDRTELELIKTKFGPDAWQNLPGFQEFKKLVKKRKTSIKAVLLDQTTLAGLGNIYVDEILFSAHVRPGRQADSLRAKEIEKIHRSVRPILKKAIKYRGTTFNSFVDANGNHGRFVNMLKVYGRAGKKCRRCGSKIVKIKVAGRGTHYCKSCQA